MQTCLQRLLDDPQETFNVQENTRHNGMLKTTSPQTIQPLGAEARE